MMNEAKPTTVTNAGMDEIDANMTVQEYMQKYGQMPRAAEPSCDTQNTATMQQTTPQKISPGTGTINGASPNGEYATIGQTNGAIQGQDQINMQRNGQQAQPTKTFTIGTMKDTGDGMSPIYGAASPTGGGDAGVALAQAYGVPTQPQPNMALPSATISPVRQPHQQISAPARNPQRSNKALAENKKIPKFAQAVEK